MAELGKHSWKMAVDPKAVEHLDVKTFSVGVFQWVPASNGKMKRSAAKVRVSGSVHDPEKVYKKAAEICDLLDAGSYSGAKSVKV